jgi:hypothetical protein
MVVIRRMMGILEILATLETLDKELGEMAVQVVMSHPGFRIIFRWLLDLLLVLEELCYCSYLDA